MKRRQPLWFVVGLIMGMAIMGFMPQAKASRVKMVKSNHATVAKIVGDNGYLMGFDVQVDGETVCHDPYVWIGLKRSSVMLTNLAAARLLILQSIACLFESEHQ